MRGNMRARLRAGYLRTRKWVRCNVLRLHSFDWREVFTQGAMTGDLSGECGDCGRRVRL